MSWTAQRPVAVLQKRRAPASKDHDAAMMARLDALGGRDERLTMFRALGKARAACQEWERSGAGLQHRAQCSPALHPWVKCKQLVSLSRQHACSGGQICSGQTCSGGAPPCCAQQAAHAGAVQQARACTIRGGCQPELAWSVWQQPACCQAAAARKVLALSSGCRMCVGGHGDGVTARRACWQLVPSALEQLPLAGCSAGLP